MAKEFKLKIVSYDKVYLDEKVLDMLIPLTTGNYQILPGHTEYIGKIGTGKIRVKGLDKEDKYFSISEGIIKIDNNEVLIVSSKILSEIEIKELNENSLLEDVEKANKELNSSLTDSKKRNIAKSRYIWANTLKELKLLKR